MYTSERINVPVRKGLREEAKALAKSQGVLFQKLVEVAIDDYIAKHKKEVK